MQRPEQEIQIAVCIHLSLRSVPGVFWFHVPNGGKRSLFVGRKLKQMGVVSGVPDLIILHNSRTFALELKAPGGALTLSQRLVMQRMRDCGAHVAVAKSLDEALVTLECWGLVKRDCSVVSESKSSPNAAGEDEHETEAV